MMGCRTRVLCFRKIGVFLCMEGLCKQKKSQFNKRKTSKYTEMGQQFPTMYLNYTNFVTFLIIGQSNR